MKTKVSQIIGKNINLLGQAQADDGSFKDEFGNKSVFFTALILSSLCKLEEEEKIKEIKSKVANFLLINKNDNWEFSQDASINFSVLSALLEYNPKILDGVALAKILMYLTSLEVKEGGPYYSENTNNNKVIDLGCNANIAHFLSLQNVELPELDKIIDRAVTEECFSSSFANDLANIFLISKFYKGDKKQKLIDFILKNIENREYKGFVDSILALIALKNLGYCVEKLREKAGFLLDDNDEELKKSYLFLEENINLNKTFLEVNRALYLEICSGLAKKPAPSEVKADVGEKQMYDLMMKLAEEKFSSLEGEIKNFAIDTIKKTIKGNVDNQMAFMPYYFKKALGKKGELVPDLLVAELGLANIFFWTAFIIYDDFWDEEGDPKILPTANLYARHFTNIFSTLFPQDKEFSNFFHQLMDNLDGANTWEVVSCRAKVEGAKVKIPLEIPNYGNYDLAYYPASAHILGPVAILYHLGYKLDSHEAQKTIDYCRNYLIAMQLNDDSHDWEDDLRRGHLSAVVVMLLKDNGLTENIIDMEKDLSDIQKLFLFKTIKRASECAIFHSEKSKEALDALSIIENPEPLLRFTRLTRNTAQQALDEHRGMVGFLKTYKE